MIYPSFVFGWIYNNGLFCKSNCSCHNMNSNCSWKNNFKNRNWYDKSVTSICIPGWPINGKCEAVIVNFSYKAYPISRISYFRYILVYQGKGKPLYFDNEWVTSDHDVRTRTDRKFIRFSLCVKTRTLYFIRNVKFFILSVSE